MSVSIDQRRGSEMRDGAILLLAIVIFSVLVTSHGFRLQRVATQPRALIKTQLWAGFGAAKAEKASAPVLAGQPCPCTSGKLYEECCEPFHLGKALPPTPTATVRSRFCALAAKLDPDWLITTTHPENKEFADADEQPGKRKTWVRNLKEFAMDYEFIELIFDDETRDSAATLENAAEGATATVAFSAKLAKAGVGERTPESLVEKSTFEKKDGKWLYRAGDVNNPFKNARVDIAPKKQKFITTAKRGVPKGN